MMEELNQATPTETMGNKMKVVGICIYVIYVLIVIGAVINQILTFDSFYFNNPYTQGIAAGFIITRLGSKLFAKRGKKE